MSVSEGCWPERCRGEEAGRLGLGQGRAAVAGAEDGARGAGVGRAGGRGRGSVPAGTPHAKAAPPASPPRPARPRAVRPSEGRGSGSVTASGGALHVTMADSQARQEGQTVHARAAGGGWWRRSSASWCEAEAVRHAGSGLRLAGWIPAAPCQTVPQFPTCKGPS